MTTPPLDPPMRSILKMDEKQHTFITEQFLEDRLLFLNCQQFQWVASGQKDMLFRVATEPIIYILKKHR